MNKYVFGAIRFLGGIVLFAVAVAIAVALLFVVATYAPKLARGQSQAMACDARGSMAADMLMVMADTGMLPKHYHNEVDRELVLQAVHCAERGEAVKDCIVRHCMEKNQ